MYMSLYMYVSLSLSLYIYRCCGVRTSNSARPHPSAAPRGDRSQLLGQESHMSIDIAITYHHYHILGIYPVIFLHILGS